MNPRVISSQRMVVVKEMLDYNINEAAASNYIQFI